MTATPLEMTKALVLAQIQAKQVTAETLAGAARLAGASTRRGILPGE